MSSEYIESTTQSGVLVVKLLADELRETDVCYATRDQILATLNPNTTDRVVIDMATTRFVGSVGLLAFLAMRRTVPAAQIMLCNVNESVFEMLVLCRLVSGNESAEAPFQVRASVDAAVAELQ